MIDNFGWIVLILIGFAVYVVEFAPNKEEQSISTVQSVSGKEEQSISTMQSEPDEEELPFGVTDLSKVEILTDESGYEYYIDESDDFGDRVYLDPIRSDGRTPEEIARDLFFEGKKVEYERHLNRSISDMEFQVMYEQEQEQEKKQQQRIASERMRLHPCYGKVHC